MILTREEFFANLRAFTEDRADDETLKFVEDMTDTYNDMESKITDNGETWKNKYDELNASWKKRYWERFFKGDGYSTPNERTDNEEDTDNEEINENITIDELFTEEKEGD